MLPGLCGEDGAALRLGRDLHLEGVRRALTTGIQIVDRMASQQWMVGDLRNLLCLVHLERECALLEERGRRGHWWLQLLHDWHLWLADGLCLSLGSGLLRELSRCLALIEQFLQYFEACVFLFILETLTDFENLFLHSCIDRIGLYEPKLECFYLSVK